MMNADEIDEVRTLLLSILRRIERISEDILDYRHILIKKNKDLLGNTNTTL